MLKKLRFRFYCLPGIILSALMNWSPSFSLSNIILRCFGAKVGSRVSIHNGVRIVMPGRLTIGNNVTINSKSFIDNRSGIYVGNNVMIGRDVQVYTLGHNVNSSDFRSVGKPVVIMDNAVIFTRSTIMPGIKIGKNSVVLPGSVVTKDVPDHSIFGGVPAKYVSDRNCEISYTLDYRMYWGI